MIFDIGFGPLKSLEVLKDTLSQQTGLTLDSAIAKGTWTASGTWTLPAITLGGTVTAATTLSVTINSAAQLAWTDGAFAFQKATTISTGGNNLLTLNGGTAGVKIATGHLGIVTNVSATVGINYIETISNPAATNYGIYTEIDANATSADNANHLYAGFFAHYVAATNNKNWTGSDALTVVMSTLESSASATGTVTGGINYYAQAIVEGITLTNRYGLYVKETSGAGTLTNQYGIYIEALTKGATLDYGIYSVNNNCAFGAGFLEVTEMAAPGAGAANTARIYAVVDGGTLTDLAAVFQDGTVDIFAQETTPLDSPLFTQPSGTEVKIAVIKEHPGVIRFVAKYSDGSSFVLRELQYHDAEKVAANKGAENPLPVGWEVATLQERVNKVVALLDEERASMDAGLIAMEERSGKNAAKLSGLKAITKPTVEQLSEIIELTREQALIPSEILSLQKRRERALRNKDLELERLK